MFLELEFFLDVSPGFFGLGANSTERFMNFWGLGPDFLCQISTQLYWDRLEHTIAVTIPREILALQSSALLCLAMISAGETGGQHPGERGCSAQFNWEPCALQWGTVHGEIRRSEVYISLSSVFPQPFTAILSSLSLFPSLAMPTIPPQWSRIVSSRTDLLLLHCVGLCAVEMQSQGWPWWNTL